MKSFLRNNWRVLLVIGCVLLVRVVYLIELSTRPGFTVPMVDEKWHWMWAQEILEKSFWGEGSYFRGPLYPYFLSFLAAVTGGSIFWAKFLQVLVCGGTAYFLFRTAEHLFDRSVALAAGLVYACYGTLLFYEAMFLLEGLFLFLIMWAISRIVRCGDRDSLRNRLSTGLVLGLAAITRPNILLVIVVLLLWILIAAPRKTKGWSRWRPPLATLAGVVLIILPVTIRNIAVTGEPALISSQGGVNFYLGNNEVASGLDMRMPQVDLGENIAWDQFVTATQKAAEREAGRVLSDAEQSSFWMAKARQFICSHPGIFLSLTWRKCVYLLSGFENSDHSDIYYERGKSILYSLLLWHHGLYFPFGLLLPLALMGVYLTRREATRLAPVYLFLLAYVPTIVLFLVTARHRLPLIPFLIILAVVGVLRLVRWWRSRTVGRVMVVPLVILAGGTLVFNRVYYDEGGQNLFQVHFNAGIVQERLGDYAAAEREYLEADTHFPYSAALITNLAHTQFQLGRLNEADRNYARALKIKPGFHRSLNNLGQLVESKGLVDSAVNLYLMAAKNFDEQVAKENELGQIYLNLGSAYERLGRIDSASGAFILAMEVAPLMGESFYRAAAFYARHGEHDLADTLFGAGQHRMDARGTDLFNWGLSLIERKRYSDGVGMMFRALKRDSSLYQAYYCIAYSLFEGGYIRDTVEVYLDRCLERDPQYEPALLLKRHLGEP